MARYELVESVVIALMTGLACAGGIVALLWMVHLWDLFP